MSGKRRREEKRTDRRDAKRASHTCDLVRRAAVTRLDHDQQLHDCVVDLGAAGLDNEDVLFSDARQNAHTGLALKRRGEPRSVCVGSPQRRQPCVLPLFSSSRPAPGSKTHIGKLAQLRVARRHAQILAYLLREHRTTRAGEYLSVSHRERGWQTRWERGTNPREKGGRLDFFSSRDR